MSSELQEKILTSFPGMVVRKDLTKLVKGNAIVPTYVLEYLLGQYCATFDEQAIALGVEKVRDILNRHYVHREDAELIKSTVRERGGYKVIDKIGVTLNEKRNVYEASFANLGLRSVEIRTEIVTTHQKLLTGGVWCIIDLQYIFDEESGRTPWVIEQLKPIQLSAFDFEEFVRCRQEFTAEEWIDLLLQSIGLDPGSFGHRTKLIQLARLIPFCERNYNLIELGPKGTGKSHVYSEFSPHGMLISGGDVTQAKLFVNNTNNQIGLVGYWDVVAFDEFAGKEKRVDKKLVDIMKNYMANKSFSRGRDVMGAEASFAFVGNTDRSVPYMLKHSDLFEALPPGYYDSAFLDRLHCYLPGWEVQKLRNEMFTSGYGFIVDYLAEVLRYLRKEDYGFAYRNHFDLSEDLTKRDRDGVTKTLSGLIKLIYPNGNCTREELQPLLAFAIEGRKRVKDQLVRIDETFEPVTFALTDLRSGEVTTVATLEERQYRHLAVAPDRTVLVEGAEELAQTNGEVARQTQFPETLKSGEHVEIEENQKGVSYRILFGRWLAGARRITIVDPYIRRFYQVKNLMEFCNLVLALKPEGEEVAVHLVTKYDPQDLERADELLQNLQESLAGSGISLTYDFSNADLHDRSIETETGWKITLGRGLDIFQIYDFKNPFELANINQEMRSCKPFAVTYLRVGEE